MIVAKDDFSGFVIADAISRKDSNTVVRFLRRVIGLFGPPEIIVGDRGEINYGEVRVMLESFGINVRVTTAFHPQANGVVERAHQELIKALERWLGEDRKGLWPDYLEFACLADNMTTRSTTGFCPFYLMFGRSLPLPIVISQVDPLDEIDRETLLVKRMEEIALLEEDGVDAYERLRQNRIHSEQIWNERGNLRKESLQAGDLVLVETDKTLVKLPKFRQHWTGPYRVSSAVGNGAYHLSELDGTQIRVPVNGSRLKLFYPRVVPEGSTMEEEG
jgi:hypothetical protein